MVLPDCVVDLAELSLKTHPRRCVSSRACGPFCAYPMVGADALKDPACSSPAPHKLLSGQAAQEGGEVLELLHFHSSPSAATHVLLFLPLPPSPHSISLFPALLWANCLTQYMMCSLCSRPSWDPSKTILQSWVQPSGCQLVIPVVEGELQPMHISALCHGIDAELQS